MESGTRKRRCKGEVEGKGRGRCWWQHRNHSLVSPPTCNYPHVIACSFASDVFSLRMDVHDDIAWYEGTCWFAPCLDHQVDINLYFTEVTALCYCREVGLKPSWCTLDPLTFLACHTLESISFHYRNTIAGSSPSEWIIIIFEKIRFTSQKTEFLNFVFLTKK